MPDPDAQSSDEVTSDIVDDETPRAESLIWAVEQFRAGKTFEEIHAGLIESGWDTDDADGIAEHARRQTRSERGVLTREQVAATVDANYRRGMGGGLFAGMPAVAALRRLLFGLASLKLLRKWKR